MASNDDVPDDDLAGPSAEWDVMNANKNKENLVELLTKITDCNEFVGLEDQDDVVKYNAKS